MTYWTTTMQCERCGLIDTDVVYSASSREEAEGYLDDCERCGLEMGMQPDWYYLKEYTGPLYDAGSN
jgi:hypothetical protein